MNQRRAGREAFSLIEVVMAVLIISVVAVALLRSLTVGAQSTYQSSIGSAAMYRCVEKVEEVLDMDFDEIALENFPEEQDLVLDGRGTANSDDDVLFSRTVNVIDEINEFFSLKRVTVTVTYTLAGQTDRQAVTTLVAKEGR